MGKRFEDDEPSLEKTTVVKGDTFRNRMEEATKVPPCLMMLEGPAGYVGKQWQIDKTDIIIGRSMTSAIFVDEVHLSDRGNRLAAERLLSLLTLKAPGDLRRQF
jgi:hypothetical protein